jgi:hypothetical protein
VPARKRIQNLAAVLGLSAFHVDAAVRLFMLALQHNFVKGALFSYFQGGRNDDGVNTLNRSPF